MKSRGWEPILSLSILLVPLSLGAQSFEGVMTQRSIELDDQAVFELMERVMPMEEEPDLDSEEAWFRYTAEKLFEASFEEAADLGEGTESTTWFKGSMMRSDSPEMGGAYLLMDLETLTMRWVIPARRVYAEMTAEDIEASRAEAERQAEEMMARMGIDPEEYEDEEYGMDEGMVSFSPSVKSLGETREINGMRADAFEAVAGTEIGIGWCSDTMAGFSEAMKAISERMDMLSGDDEDEGGDGSGAVDLLCEDRLPVRTQVLRMDDFGGGFWYSLEEIVSIEETSVPDDRFEVPDGYTKVSMHQLWGG
jgi:hypothetical protein